MDGEENFSKITSSIYLGSEDAFSNPKILDSANVSHILSLVPTHEVLIPPSIAENRILYRIPLTDSVTEPIVLSFAPAIEFLVSAIESNGTVFVHCYSGISRSPSVLAAFLIHYHALSAHEALSTLQSCRSLVDPNPSFVAQLKWWEELGMPDDLTESDVASFIASLDLPPPRRSPRNISSP